MNKEISAVPLGTENPKGGEIINIFVAEIKKLISQLEKAENGMEESNTSWALKEKVRKTPAGMQEKVYYLLTKEYFKETAQRRVYLESRRDILEQMPARKALEIVEKLMAIDEALAWTDLEALKATWSNNLKKRKYPAGEIEAVKKIIEKAQQVMDKIDDNVTEKKAV